MSYFKSYLLLSLIGCCQLQANAQLEKVKEQYLELEKESIRDPKTIQFIQAEMDLVDEYEQLSQIILLRHGEPALNKKGWRKRKEAMAYVIAYDTVGIYPPSFEPVSITPYDLEVIHCSAINRSYATARYLFEEEMLQPDSLFREFERKIFGFFNIKLPLKWWLTPSRIFWIMGFNKKGIERFSDAKRRAREVAGFLEDDAMDNGKSLLVSHGLLNHFLVKYLKKNGWTVVFDGGKGYLSQKMLVKYAGD